jgi:hypothetical protein
MNDQTIKENRVTADPQLNRLKKPMATSDVDLAMILAAVYVGVAQEVPKLPAGRQGASKAQG